MTRKRQPGRESRRVKGKVAPAPLIASHVIPKSSSGKSVVGAAINVKNIHEFLPRPETLERARQVLTDLGFQISIVGRTHIGIRGSRELYERVFKVKLAEKTVQRSEAFGKKIKQSYVVSSTPPRVPEELTETVETIEFPGPIVYHMPISPVPPATLNYDHMKLPEDVARGMDAVKVHALGVRGTGIRIALVDSGFMTNPAPHPYFVGKGYQIQPVVSGIPGDPIPNEDPKGHGTAMAAVILAVAPGVTLMPYKNDPSDFLTAFSLAVQARPDIITCSWGWSYHTSLHNAIVDAVGNLGIVVLFAGGNKGPIDWPGWEPSVISVGGAFLGPDDSLQASSHASSGTVMVNGVPRQVPDLCGIGGRGVEGGTDFHGMLITMPTQPGSYYDALYRNNGNAYPDGDMTPLDDGWWVASGSSSATAMVAGVTALVLENNPALRGQPAQVLNTLRASCLDVTVGQSASLHPAGPGPDVATGSGLVQAYRAIRTTDLWIKDNPDSDIGLVPTHNGRPKWPPFAHWNSPDIKVFSAPLGKPAVDFDNTSTDSPVFGQDNYVYVQARNRGTGASPQVTVGLFYGDPGTNLIFPADWNDGQSGVPGQGSIQVGGVGMNVQTVASIAAGGAVVLPTPFVWRPPNPTLATQSQVLPNGRIAGHFCLLVRLSSADDPIMVPGGMQASVINDNNIGMSNQQVISIPGKRLVHGPFRFTFFVKGARAAAATRNDLLFDLRGLPRSRDVRVEVEGLAGRKMKLVRAKRSADRLKLSVGPRPAGVADLLLSPGVKILVTVSVTLPRGSARTDYPINVTQAGQGHALGGMTLIARVV